MTEESKAREAAPAEAVATSSSSRKNPPPEERPTLLGGRLLIGVALLVGIAAVAPQGMNSWLDRTLHPAEPKPAVSWTVGSEANVELTLITADSQILHCAHDETIEGAHCAYTANKKPWPRTPGAVLDDNDENVIRPYRTADTNALILVAGLWAQPELAMRVHREPPGHYDADKQLRFVAYCKVRFIGELKKAALRWQSGGKWHDDQTALVARPQRCTLEAPSG
jgi:hypothetical protein